MRLFVAITLDEKEKARLRRGIEILRAQTDGGTFPRVENLHLTVVFLGELAQRRAADACVALEHITCKPFRVETDGPGTFQRDDGAICWLGIRANRALDQLYCELCGELKHRGFEVPSRQYRPHLTLGRRVQLKDTAALECAAKSVGKLTIAVDGLTLMESSRIGGRLVYRPVSVRKFEE